MKKCTYCGLENPDEAAMCSTCHTGFGTESPPALAPPFSREYLMSVEEQRFWKQLSARHIIIIILRMAGLWLLFLAALQTINLAPLFSALPHVDYYPLPPVYISALAPVILRIALYVATGLVLIFYTEKLLGWLVKDLVSKPQADAPPSNSTQA
jgi:hypothetical protein